MGKGTTNIESVWKESKSVAIALCTIAALIATYLQVWLSLPGVSVAVLGAVAAVMSLRPEMKIREKAAWMVIITSLLISEIRSIRKDRTDSETSALAERQKQENSFKAIRDEQNREFAATAKSLKDAIAVATQTFEQTVPHADIHPTDFSIVNGPQPPSMFEPETEYIFNFSYANSGTEQGTILKRVGRIYVAPPDDEVAQKQIAGRFEKDWNRATKKFTPNIVQSGGNPGIWSAPETLSADDVNALKFKRNTVYVIRRIQYRDRTGTWWSDRCEHFQVEGDRIDLNMFHPCTVLMNGRYKAGWVSK